MNMEDCLFHEHWTMQEQHTQGRLVENTAVYSCTAGIAVLLGIRVCINQELYCKAGGVDPSALDDWLH